MDRFARLFENFDRGMHQMGFRICRVLKLSGHKDAGIFRCHLRRARGACADALPDVSVIVDQNGLGAVMPHDLAAFLTDRVRHDDHGTITAHGTNQRKPDTLITAGRFHNDAVLVQQSCPLSSEDHVVRRPRLDGAADVHGFKFDQNLRSIAVCHAVQPHKRCTADCFQNIFADHVFPPDRCSADSVFKKSRFCK